MTRLPWPDLEHTSLDYVYDHNAERLIDHFRAVHPRPNWRLAGLHEAWINLEINPGRSDVRP